MIEFKQKKKEEELNGQPASTNEQVVSSAPSTVQSATQQQQKGASTQSGSFKNLQDYLRANADQNFGGQVAGKVDERTDAARQAQTQSSNQFKSQVDQGTVKYNQDLVDRATYDPYSFVYNPKQKQNPVSPQPQPAPTQNPVSKPLPGAVPPAQKEYVNTAVKPKDPNAPAPVAPSAFHGNDYSSRDLNFSNLQEFIKQRDAAYGGPKALADKADLYDSAYSATDKAKKTADLSKSEAGRFSLLDEFYARPDYAKGQKSLDNLLLQNDPTARSAFKAAQQRADQTSSDFESLKQSLSDYAGLGEQQTKEARSKTREKLGIDDVGNLVQGAGAIGSTEAALKSALDSRLAALPAEQKRIQDRLADWKSRGYASEVAGLEYLWGADPTKYLTSVNPNDLTMSTTATPEQQAKYQALSQLAGIENTLVPDSDKVGMYDTESLAGVDLNALMSRVANQQADYTNSDIVDYWQAYNDYRKSPTDGKKNYLNQDKFKSWWNQINAATDELNRVRAQYGLPAMTQYEMGAANSPAWLLGQRRDKVDTTVARPSSPTVPAPAPTSPSLPSNPVSKPPTQPTTTSPSAPPSSAPPSTPTPPSSPPLVGGPVTAPSVNNGSRPRDPSWGNLVVPQSAPPPAPAPVPPAPVVAAPVPVGTPAPAPTPIAPSPVLAPTPAPIVPPTNKAIITPVLPTAPIVSANKQQAVRQAAETAPAPMPPSPVSPPVVAQSSPIIAPPPSVVAPSPVVAQSLPSPVSPTVSTSKLVPSAPAPVAAPAPVVSTSKVAPSTTDAQLTALISKILKGM